MKYAITYSCTKYTYQYIDTYGQAAPKTAKCPKCGGPAKKAASRG